MTNQKRKIIYLISGLLILTFVSIGLSFQRQLREEYWLWKLEDCWDEGCEEVLVELSKVGSVKSIKPILTHCDESFKGWTLRLIQGEAGLELRTSVTSFTFDLSIYRKFQNPQLVFQSIKSIHIKDMMRVDSVLKQYLDDIDLPSETFAAGILFNDRKNYLKSWEKRRDEIEREKIENSDYPNVHFR